MEMEGMKFQPEAEKPRADDVALIDRLLKTIVPDAEFDGTRVSWGPSDARVGEEVDYSLSPDMLAAAKRIGRIRGTDDLLATLIVRPLQRKLTKESESQSILVTKLGFFLNGIPPKRKMLANDLLRKETVNVAADRKQERKSHSSSTEERGTELTGDTQKLEYLFATYRAKWIASGGHADPSTFLGAPESLRKWGMDADKIMRKTIDQPGDESVVRGTALELFLGVEIDQQRWFGAEVVRVAAVDDYSNSLDLALEFPFDAELGIVPRLAIDFTTAESRDVLDKKLKKLGKGTSVNFFRSKVEKNDRGEAFEGRVEDLPMVILGVNGAVLSEVGASLRRGEKIGPDHPVKAVLLRQAEIQVGLQIRTLAAEFARNALRNMPTEISTRRAVEAYAAGFESGSDFLKNIPAIRDVMKSVPVGGMEYYLGKGTTSRLRNLLAVHKGIERQLAKTDERNPEARRLGKSIRLSQALQEIRQQPAQSKISPIGEIFLRVARLRHFCETLRRAHCQQVAHLPLGIVGLARQRVDRRDGLVGGSVGWGYLAVGQLGHRV